MLPAAFFAASTALLVFGALSLGFRRALPSRAASAHIFLMVLSILCAFSGAMWVWLQNTPTQATRNHAAAGFVALVMMTMQLGTGTFVPSSRATRRLHRVVGGAIMALIIHQVGTGTGTQGTAARHTILAALELSVVGGFYGAMSPPLRARLEPYHAPSTTRTVVSAAVLAAFLTGAASAHWAIALVAPPAHIMLLCTFFALELLWACLHPTTAGALETLVLVLAAFTWTLIAASSASTFGWCGVTYMHIPMLCNVWANDVLAYHCIAAAWRRQR